MLQFVGDVPLTAHQIHAKMCHAGSQRDFLEVYKAVAYAKHRGWLLAIPPPPRPNKYILTESGATMLRKIQEAPQ